MRTPCGRSDKLNDETNNHAITRHAPQALTEHASSLASRGLVALKARPAVPLAPQKRWLKFPVESVGSIQWLKDIKEEQIICERVEARGDIEVPEGLFASLTISKHVTDFSFLAGCDPHKALNKVQYITFPVSRRSPVTEEDIQWFEHLKSLRILCIFGATITDAGLQQWI